MTPLVEDPRTVTYSPARRAPTPAHGQPNGPARHAGWWPAMVVAAGALTGAGLGYRVGTRRDHGAERIPEGVRRR